MRLYGNGGKTVGRDPGLPVPTACSFLHHCGASEETRGWPPYIQFGTCEQPMWITSTRYSLSMKLEHVASPVVATRRNNN